VGTMDHFPLPPFASFERQNGSSEGLR
jgi:hypothetical protein